MKVDNQKTWTKDDMDLKTRMNEHKIRDAKMFIENCEADLNKEKRLENQVCKVCTYQPPRIAFQAFTDTNCSKCNTDMTFSNSNIDKLCERCARMLEACKHCGSHMD